MLDRLIEAAQTAYEAEVTEDQVFQQIFSSHVNPPTPPVHKDTLTRMNAALLAAAVIRLAEKPMRPTE